MGNIISYLKWRGDLTLQTNPFNEVDNLVLSYLSYFDFSGIVPGPEEEGSIAIKDAAELFFLSNSRTKKMIVETDLLEEAAKTARFGGAKLWGYEDITDNDREMTQFAALHIALEDGTDYVSFRGTDNTIVGWREDFRMGFETVPAQKRAVKYLEKTIEKCEKKHYRIGGHSKGGNLSVYSAMMCDAMIKEQIIKIYMNDSPGLCPAMLQEELYQQIAPKIVKIVPEFCMIGMLFEKDCPPQIVKSSLEGIMQHDALTWQVEGNQFVASDELSAKSRLYSSIFDHWIESADLEQRRTFTNDFFNALEAGGATMMTDVVKGGMEGFESILFAMANSKSESKVVVGKLFLSFFKGLRHIDYRKLLKEREMLQAVIIFLTGALFIIFPDIALNIIGTTFFLWLLLFSLLRLRAFIKDKNEWKPDKKIRAVCYSMIAFLEILCILFNNIVVVSTNIILGFFFGWRACFQVKNAARQKAKKKKSWIWPLLESVIACILGLVILAKSGEGMHDYILVAGTYLTIWGMSAIGKNIFKSVKNDN